MVHDYSMAAWLLSPVPEIRQDVADNLTNEEHMAVDRLLPKLFLSHEDTEEDVEIKTVELLNIFWDEYELFKSKHGVFSSRPHMWSSSDIHNNMTHHPPLAQEIF